MTWNKNDYPDSMKNLTESTRTKAIEIANALLEDGFEEGRAISIAISKAKEMNNSTNNPTYHIVPHDGDWAIKKEHSSKVMKVFQTKNEALAKANKLVRQNNARLVIHRQDGTIERAS